METVLNYVGFALIAPFYWIHLARRALADRATNSYLQDISEASLLSNFGSALAPLVAGTDHIDRIFDKFSIKNAAQIAVWNEQSFAHFLEAASGGALQDSLDLLWRFFSRAAYFPLNPPYALNSSSQVDIDLDFFRRAFALLVLQGIQVLGFEPHWTGGSIPDGYRKKLPRIARFILTCAAGRVMPQASELEKLEATEDLTGKNVQDVIVFSQPPTYQQPFSDLAHDTGVPPSALRDATQRIVSSAQNQPNYVAVYPAIRRDDLEALLRISLMVCVHDRRWRNGYSCPTSNRASHPISADIQYSRIDLDEAFQSQKLARNVMAWYFQGECEDVSYSSFEQSCAQCPTFLLLFHHIWASIFSSGSRPCRTVAPEIHSTMPLTIVNSLSLLNVAKLDSHEIASGRFFARELQVNLDLQASTLVLEDVDNIRQTRASLQRVLVTDSHFHILLVHGEDIVSESPGKRSQRLLAIFVAPQDPTMEIWRTREGADYGYTWRYSYIDLLPDIETTNTGPMRVYLGCQGSKLTFVTQAIERMERVLPSIRLDMENRILMTSTQEMRWTSLQCYRMPGTACRVTYHPSKSQNTWVNR